jgi:hypothetical protein
MVNYLKKKLKMYWPLMAWIISFVLDQQYGILEHSGFTNYWANIVRAFGALLLAYMTGNKLVYKSNSKINEPHS